MLGAQRKRCRDSLQREKTSTLKCQAELVAGLEGYGMRGVRKIILFAELAVDPAGDNGGGWTFHAARVSTQENCKRDFRVRVVGVGDEPANFRRRRVVVASPRLPERHLVAAPVEARFAGAVQHRGEHTFANLWKYRADIQFALHARRKILNFFLAVGVLQVIKSSAVRECRGERRKLQRGCLNPFAKTGHPRDSAIRGRYGRKRTRMFVRQVVPGEFSQTEKAPVLGNRVESHTRPKLLKKHVIRVRH